MLEVTCKGCGKTYKAPEKFAGRKMNCKACSEVMVIGEEAAPESSSAPVEEEVSQAPAASEEKASTGKKPSFKKGGFSSRKGGKKSSFKKGGFSSSKTSDGSGGASEGQAAGSKKSPAMLVVVLLLVVGGLAAVDFFVTNMVIGGKDPGSNQEVAAVDDSPRETPADEPGAPADPEAEEPEASEPEAPAGVEEPEEPEDPVEEPAEPAEEAPALAKISATSVPAASVIPAGAQIILGLNLPRLIAAYEGISGEKLPRTPEALAAMSPGAEAPEAELETVKKAMAAGLDPFNSIRSILVAGEMPEDSPIAGLEDFGAAGAAAAGSNGVILVEGEFSDPVAIVSALVELEVLSSSPPEVKAGLNIYSAAEGQSINGRFTFLSASQMLFATDAWLDKVIALRKGEGEAISSNEVFSSLSDGLARKEGLWLVVDLPKEVGDALQAGLSTPPGGLPGQEDEAPTPAIKIESLMLALDSGGSDFSMELVGVTPSPADAENTKTTIGTQLGGISLLAMQMLGPKALGLMGKLNPKSDGNNVIISFKLNETELATVKEMAEKAMSGFAGPGGSGFEEPPLTGGEDSSELIEAPSDPEEAAVDPGDEGEEPEKEDEKEDDDPLELEDF